ncbi:MAG: hypothetical protein IJZ47_01240 [Oscillospiraceae bacterium]|nr:hypothetical protein [Oscillospiraceae bacterium]
MRKRSGTEHIPCDILIRGVPEADGSPAPIAPVDGAPHFQRLTEMD